MRIEKLSENRVRITLNTDDLKEKNIDLHDFMARPIESQTLFLDMLDLAEQKLGFTTKDYRISIEALAISTGDFVFTLTRTKDSIEIKHKKVHMKRKSIDLSKKSAVYAFSSFDDFVQFCSFLDNSNIVNISKVSKRITLYLFEDKYYIVFTNLNSDIELLKGFLSSITEFAEYIHHSELFERKLHEHGKLVIKNNAITTGTKYFIHK